MHRHTHDLVVDDVRGLPVLAALDVLLAAARDLALLDVVVLLDSALRQHAVRAEQILGAVSGRRRGARRLHHALQFADARSESPWETLLRVLLRSSGIDVRAQHQVWADGRFVARGDLWVAGTRTLQEYDGGVHRDRGQHAADLGREAALNRIRWRRYGYVARTVLHDGALIVRDAERALGLASDPGRLGRWNELLAASSYSRPGLARLASCWAHVSPASHVAQHRSRSAAQGEQTRRS